MIATDVTRSWAIEQLRLLGLRGPEIYLLDAVPVAGMCWADGELQVEELQVLRDFTLERMDEVNRIAGYPVLRQADAVRFLHRLMREKPSPSYLRLLTHLVRPVRLATSDERLNRQRRSAILAACLEAGAAAPSRREQNTRARFSREEKTWFEEVCDALSA
ncbi:MAG TPA: hypothetical protein VEY30_02680 [Myxococcaceae bacterium]|nr:hypothetical protein [Myxococcaceae bacterium]